MPRGGEALEAGGGSGDTMELTGDLREAAAAAARARAAGAQDDNEEEEEEDDIDEEEEEAMDEEEALLRECGVTPKSRKSTGSARSRRSSRSVARGRPSPATGGKRFALEEASAFKPAE